MRVLALVLAGESDESEKRFPAFSREERKLLESAMLEDVLVALRSSTVNEVVVIGSDLGGAREVTEWCGFSFHSTGQKNLNVVLQESIARCKDSKADAVLILPSNIPLISSSDIDGIVKLGSQEPSLVLSPSIKGGTNAVFLNPPDLMQISFGPKSFFNIVQVAIDKDVALKFFSSRELALDMESEEDLGNLLETRNKKLSKQVFKQIKLH